MTGEVLPSLRRDGYYAITPPPKSTVAQIEHSDRTARRRELPGLLDRYERERNGEKRRILYALIERACLMEGIEPPAPDAIGRTAPPIPDAVETFFDALRLLQAQGAEVDLHRRPTLLAISFSWLGPLFKKAKIDCPNEAELWKAFPLHPAFESHGSVNCRDGRARTCWVFDRAKLPGFEPA